MMREKLAGLLAAAATMTSVLSAVTPASAATFTWENLTQTYEVKDKSTDASGFQSLIPQFQQYVQQERIAIPDNKLNKLDPSKLSLKYDNNIRVWFLNEGAGYKDQLAYEAIKGSDYQKGLLFNNISCNSSNSACQLGEDDGVLDVGDYVDLGKISGGTQLNFFLKADGFNNPNGNVYGADATQNPDKLDHLVAYEVDGYLLLGFEDLYGPEGSTAGGNGELLPADRDFNDVVFLIDFGKDNIATVPEPASAIALLGVGAAGLVTLRRRRNTQTKETV
ncbi:PEP-CTERM sorting domain-containing protein [Nostocales cyanobacterium HT-58-2]|nr:PEP-CTERM sorting domain-containing protein [Nostocales cyanobacterium HT-58-2]